MQKNTKDLADKKSIVSDNIDKDLKVTHKTVKKAPDSTRKANTLDSKKKSTSSSRKTNAKKSSDSAKSISKKNVSKNSTKATAKKSSTSKTSKSTSSKKAIATKKITSAKTNRKSTSSKKSKKVEIVEYYDLPYRYNQTVVKILAQTPNTLFVYWDISDDDRKKYIEEFGKDFFESTIPVLIVHNRTMNYSFEIEINDFANSWYFNVNDAKCDYEIELGRRPKPLVANISLPNNYMHIASSNIIEAPNNHILFEKNQKILFFRNVKNNYSFTKNISQFEFMNYIGRIYNIYDVYKTMYKEDELVDLEKKNPTSGIK